MMLKPDCFLTYEMLEQSISFWRRLVIKQVGDLGGVFAPQWNENWYKHCVRVLMMSCKYVTRDDYRDCIKQYADRVEIKGTLDNLNAGLPIPKTRPKDTMYVKYPWQFENYHDFEVV